MDEIDTSTTQGKIAVMQAHADGKVIQCNITPDWMGITKDYQTWDWSKYDYRIKPLEFPPLPDGLEWSNPQNKTPEEVGEDWRLLTTKEANLQWLKDGEFWRCKTHVCHPNTWGPCDGREKGCYASPHQSIRVPISTPFPEPPKKKVMVPLGPENVPPGSVFCGNLFGRGWFNPTSVCTSGISHPEMNGAVAIVRWRSWDELQKSFMIKRPGEDWQSCEKEAVS